MVTGMSGEAAVMCSFTFLPQYLFHTIIGNVHQFYVLKFLKTINLIKRR